MSSIYKLCVIVLLFLASCETIGVFEKNVSIPAHEWSSSFRPEISFDISDTSSPYNLFVVLRHTDAYRYNNLWINLYYQIPGDTMRKQRLELKLATDDKGWLGSGMDDIFEHRILVAPLHFRKAGTYRFRLENIMREDPLGHIMNVGVRVEKVKG